MKENLIPSNMGEIQNTWNMLQSCSVDEPVYRLEIVRRIARAQRSGRPVTLFVPWGVRPEGAFGNPETSAMTFLSQFSQDLKNQDIPNRVMIMPADLYATQINGMDEQIVGAYFADVRAIAESQGFSVKPWSEIKEENLDQYESTKQWRASADSIWANMPKNVWYRDILPAALRRNNSPTAEEQRASAFAYLQERICEAVIIEDQYLPIKISMVSPNRDDFVDAELPRLYLLSREMRYPWLKGNGYEEE